MGKKWDNTGIAYSVEFWQEVYRVLKPGGHLLSFGGSRTYHRMACAIEDAGFEIRDMIEWVYGSGFPKSLNIGKSLDKMAGVEREVISTLPLGAGPLKTGHVNKGGGGGMSIGTERSPEINITAPATNAAKQWDGWGTALKPAHEPICMARKPIEGTVAANVMKYGTGGINVDGCRVGTETITHFHDNTSYQKWKEQDGRVPKDIDKGMPTQHTGRFPANLIHDGSDEVVAMFPVTSSGKMHSFHNRHTDGSPNGIYGKFDEMHPLSETIGDSGSAARFFYAAKASPAERNRGCDGLEKRKGGMVSNTSGQHLTRRDDEYEVKQVGNFHPTVKPISLMRYLVRLVTPPGGVCYDPFAGSGTTLIACKEEGFNYIGSEMTDEYIPIIHARLAATVMEEPQPTSQLTLF